MLGLIVAGWLVGDAGVVILDVESRVLDKDDRAAVQVRVASGAADATDLEVLTTADLRALADVAATQQSLDCDGSSECLSELADAYGAATVVSVRVNKVAARYVVELVALDAHSAKVLRRVDGTSTRGQLLDVAKQLGVELFTQPVAPGASPLFVAGVVTGVVGAAATVAGGLGALVAEGAVRGADVSAADKDLGFRARLPLVGVAVVGVVVGVVGVGLVVAGGGE